MYHEELQEHFRFPRNKGKLDNPDFSAEDENPSCGDKVSFQGMVVDGRLADIRFMGQGCVISQATASMLSEAVKGKAIEEILALTSVDVVCLIGMELGPTRLRCALLALSVLQGGIKMIY